MSSLRRWEPAGEARGSVTLVHGVMALAETWWRIGPALARRGWSVEAVDLPGHAGDVRRNGALDLDAFVDGVAARLDGPVDLLVGHSLGAIVALGLVGRDPGAARALVLEEPPGLGAVDLGALATVIVQDAAAVRIDRAPLVAREREANPRWDPGDVERSVRGIEEADSEAIATALDGPLRWELSALLDAVDVPVLVLAARDAPGRFPLDAGSALRGADREAVRSALAPGRFVEIEGGHCLHRDDAQRWLQAVDGFARAALG
jgi:pimeloyl-ACP methyl ester carboxylesterase